MECVFGLVGDGFAVIAADTSAVNSIVVHKSTEEVQVKVQFTEYIHKNVHLYQFCNRIPLTTAATANFTRCELATALRKSGLYKVTALVLCNLGEAIIEPFEGVTEQSIVCQGTCRKIGRCCQFRQHQGSSKGSSESSISDELPHQFSEF
ncbi:hypothetical protein EJ110_NYTH07036 [Nymphaea thermarum]|nr:hypothetical protein EJ110_NYTH07036 [Nymphaea thermarum]